VFNNLNLKKFYSDLSGNISITFAICITVLLVAMGGAVDFANAFSNKSKFQDIADATALAAVKGDNVSQMKKIGKAYIEQYNRNKTDRFVLTKDKINARLNGGKKTVTVELQGKPETYFLHLIGMDNIPFKASSTVTEAETDIEISLVLDISFSMTGNKIANLRTAANEFIDKMIGSGGTSSTTSISIIPFGGNVNIGASLAEKLMASNVSADFDPDDYDYRQSVLNPETLATSNYRFTDGMNCIETSIVDYDTGIIPDHSRSQLPRFVNRNSMLPICPEDVSAILFNSNNKNALKRKINTMQISHGTAMDAGALWGLKALSPSHRGVVGGSFSDRPYDFDGSSQKVLVIMSDGNITGQGRPREPNNPNRLSGGTANPGNMPTYDAGTTGSASGDNDGVGRFKKVCDIAAQQNIDVYTVGYNISSGEIADTLLSECVTSSRNYFFVENADINKAFETIASSLSELRISN